MTAFYTLAERLAYFERITGPLYFLDPAPSRMPVEHADVEDWQAFVAYEPLPMVAGYASVADERAYWARYVHLSPLNADAHGKTIPTYGKRRGRRPVRSQAEDADAAVAWA